MSEEGTSHEASSSLHYSSAIKTEYVTDVEYIDESATCRVCLKDGHIPIFDQEVTDDIVEGLMVFGSIVVDADDAFPKFLCKACYGLLQGAILLRKTAQQTDQLLRQTTEHESGTVIQVKSEITTNIESETEEIIVYNSDGESNYEMEADETTVLKQALKGGSELECQKCNLIFMTYKQYKNHISEEYCKYLPQPQQTGNLKRLSKSKNIICKRCDIEFKTFKQYQEHIISEDHINRRVLCPVCKKTYAPHYLRKHMQLHRAQTQYVCDVCGKEFIQQVQLIRHRLIHFRDLPFKCMECPYKSRLKESLKMHMRVHTGERPYQCEECPSRFVSKSNLNKHMLTHKKTHDFICDSCGRGFFSKRELDVHIKVEHGGVKEHICNVCNKAFGYRKQMMKHQRIVHKREKLQSGRTPVYLLLEKEKVNENLSHNEEI